MGAEKKKKINKNMNKRKNRTGPIRRARKKVGL